MLASCEVIFNSCLYFCSSHFLCYSILTYPADLHRFIDIYQRVGRYNPKSSFTIGTILDLDIIIGEGAQGQS